MLAGAGLSVMMIGEFSKLLAINLKLNNMQTHSLGNIVYEKKISLATDFIDENGFFVRSAVDAVIKYCPLNCLTDAEAITKTITASPYFVDPVICRKVFRLVTTPDVEFYAGYGV
jgi:hypothetical protein